MNVRFSCNHLTRHFCRCLISIHTAESVHREIRLRQDESPVYYLRTNRKWLFSLDAVRGPRSWLAEDRTRWERQERQKKNKNATIKGKREKPNGRKRLCRDAKTARRRLGKGAMPTVFFVAGIFALCRPRPLRTSSSPLPRVLPRPPFLHPHAPCPRSCDALDFLARRLLYPRSRRTTITRPCYHHRRNHHRPQPRRPVLTCPPT